MSVITDHRVDVDFLGREKVFRYTRISSYCKSNKSSIMKGLLITQYYLPFMEARMARQMRIKEITPSKRKRSMTLRTKLRSKEDVSDDLAEFPLFC